MIRTLAILLGAVALGALLLLVAPQRPSGGGGKEAATQAEDAGAPGADTAAGGGREALRADRNVTGRDMTRAQTAAGKLKRLPPRPPLSKPETPTAENDPGEAKPTLLPRPVATDAAHLSVGKATVVLPGVKPVPLERSCGSGDAAWPCGMMARTELRRLIGLRSVMCKVPDGFGDREATVTSPCSLASEDLGAWVVRNGWAEAAPGGPYGDAEAAAKRERRGIWRP